MQRDRNLCKVKEANSWKSFTHRCHYRALEFHLPHPRWPWKELKPRQTRSFCILVFVFFFFFPVNVSQTLIINAQRVINIRALESNRATFHASRINLAFDIASCSRNKQQLFNRYHLFTCIKNSKIRSQAKFWHTT